MIDIAIQIIHIQGPAKGTVQEFSQFPVRFGRHSSCEVRFDKSMTALSRHHCRIERHDNRFRIIDSSVNGTFVNGKRIANVSLRDGDILMFSEDGPQVSFVTKIETGRKKPSSPQKSDLTSFLDAAMTLDPDKQLAITFSNAPLVIQFGPTIQTYNLLPVTIGTDPSCEFVVRGNAIADRHAKIFYGNGNYYVADLTKQGKVSVNNRVVGTQAVLSQGAELSLSAKGPKFKFFEDGRLVAIQEAPGASR